MQRYQVVVTDSLAEMGPERGLLDDIADIALLQTNDEADVARHATHADVLLVYHTIKLSERPIAKLVKCRGIIRCGVGYDNVDLQAAGRHGIVVCNVPDYGTEEVADHALLMLLAIARRFIPSNHAVRDGNWDCQVAFGTPRLRGRTLGIVGCGRIGTAMVLRARALGMRVVIYDPYRPDGVEKSLGVDRLYRLEDLLAQSEFVSLHCPLTAETRHLLNARTLALLPRGAYVINTARGPCVDGAALVAALDSGHVAYAALDVVEEEPLRDEGLRRHERIVLTPHTAFYSVEGFQEMRSKGAAEARRILLGEAPRNVVNREWLVNSPTGLPRRGDFGAECDS
jgi:phosphoglycerate dehydrogenase-like enzyme